MWALLSLATYTHINNFISEYGIIITTIIIIIIIDIIAEYGRIIIIICGCRLYTSDANTALVANYAVMHVLNL